MAKRILVVDNERNLVDVLSKLLAMEGLDVLTTTEGGSALALAKKVIPDLILLDILMPGMTGDVVAAKLLEDDVTKNIPVLFLTASVSDEEALTQNKKAGNRIYFSKASSVPDLIKTIKKILGL